MMDLLNQNNYFSNISKIVNFFRRTSGSGFLFCVCNDPRVIFEVNRQVIQRCAEWDIQISELLLSGENRDHLIGAVKEAAASSPHGIIVNNLDTQIQETDGRIIGDLNFSREILIDLGICFVFWLSEKNMPVFANKATDLYLRRDRSTLRFADPVEKRELHLSIPLESIEESHFERLGRQGLKIQLLEKELKEAVEKKYEKKRVATEIVFDLVTAYLESNYISKAYQTFTEYKIYFEDSGRLDYLWLTAQVYFVARQFDIAEKIFLKCKEIQEQIGDLAGMASSCHRLGIIAQEQRDFAAAREWYLKSLEIKEKHGDEHRAASTYHQLGRVAQEQRDFAAAREWYLKSLKITEKQGDGHGAARNYDQIGLLCLEKRNHEESACWLIKSIKAFDRSHDEERARQGIRNYLLLYNQAETDTRKVLIKKWNDAGLGDFPVEQAEKIKDGGED